MLMRYTLHKLRFFKKDFGISFLFCSTMRGKFITFFNHFTFDMHSASNGHPLHCDCDLYHLKQILEEITNHSSQDVIGLHRFLSWKCQVNTLLTFGTVIMPFMQLNNSQFICAEETSCPDRCICYVGPDGYLYIGQGKANILVDCSGTKQTEIPGFMPEPGITSIAANFLYNEITYFPDCDFKRYHWLKLTYYLNMRGNHLTPDVSQFQNFISTCLVNMKRLFIAYNNIQYLPPSIQDVPLTSFSINNNKLKCDCNNKWMKSWINRSPYILVKEHVYCTNSGK